MEISEALRVLLQKADEWEEDLIVTEADVEGAFDNIGHNEFSFQAANATDRHWQTAAFALVREIVGKEYKVYVNDSSLPVFECRRGR